MRARNSLLLLLSVYFILPVASQPIHLESGKITLDSRQAGIASQQASGNLKIVQFSGTLASEERKELEKNGVRFLSYIPENAWIVRSETVLESRENVKAVSDFRPEYRLGKNVDLEQGGPVHVQVNFFSDVKSAEARKTLEDHRITGKIDDRTWNIRVSTDRVMDLASSPRVESISRTMPEPEVKNDNSRALIEVEKLHSLPFNLTGDGFTAAEWDGGWAGNHSDLNYTGKTIRGDAGCTNSECSVQSHATHVAGTMVGNGSLDSNLKGMAPDARLVTYEWATSGGSELFSETHGAINQYDAVVSQNSWGYKIDSNTDLMGNYQFASDEYDEIISNDTLEVNGTLSIVFSAGNERDDHPMNYNTTSGAGSTSKNTITVGAVTDSGAMTSFSSWGPTDDGRIKPDVVANGYSVKSTVPYNDASFPYGFKSGTSMAAPAVSGTVILINQKFNQTYGRKPEPATVKGLLIQTAEDLNRTGPDYTTGWGLVNATAAINYINVSKRRDLIHRDRLSQGETHNYSFEVDSSEPVNISLVWSDYPAAELASKTLVNDLDLVVKNSTGHRYYPWTLNWSTKTEVAKRTRKDDTNPVEQVHVPDPQTDELTIQVKGSSVPQPEQSYTLLMSSAGNDTEPADLTILSPSNTNYTEIPDFNVSSNEALEQALVSVNGTNHSMQKSTETFFYNITAEISDGEKTATFFGEDLAGNWNSTSVNFTLDTAPPSLEPVSPVKNANISASFNVTATWNDSIHQTSSAEFYVSNSSGQQFSGSLNGTVNLGSLKDGAYNITWNATDSLGNSVTEKRSVTLDTELPKVKTIEPGNTSVKSDFWINATFNDSGTGLDTREYFFRNSTGTQKSGDLNTSITVSDYPDGNYTAVYSAEDFAGNEKNHSSEIKIDTSAPKIGVESPVNDSNVSGTFTINATVSDASPVNLSRYRWHNSTSNVTSWRSFNDTFNTSKLEDGEYNISFQANDSLGNLGTVNITGITVDSQGPLVQLSEFNESRREDGWIVDSRKVNASCTDTGTGADRIAVFRSGSKYRDWKQPDTNFTVNASGTHNYSFRCEDLAGNQNSTDLTLSIDSRKPELQSEDPSNSSETDRSLTVTADLFNESTESWLNISGSELNVTRGSLDNLSWTNSSFTAEISGLDYSTGYALNGTIEDNAGHNYTVRLEYTTKSKTDNSGDGDDEDEPSGGGGPGGGAITDFTATLQKQYQDGKYTIENLDPQEQKEVTMENDRTPLEELEVDGDEETGFEISDVESGFEPPVDRISQGEFNLSKTEDVELDLNVSFTVNKSSITGPGRVSLYRRNSSEWQELETYLVENRSGSYLFRSEVPGFSIFMIASETPEPECEKKTFYAVRNSSCTSYNQCEPPENATLVESCESYQSSKAENSTENRTTSTERDHRQGIPAWLYLLAAAAIIIPAGFYGYRKYEDYRMRKNLRRTVEQIIQNINNPRQRKKMDQIEELIEDGRYEDAYSQITEIKDELRRYPQE